PNIIDLTDLRPNVTSPAGNPPFDDTYGRISSAAESVAKISALESEIGVKKDLMRLTRDDTSVKDSIRSVEQQISLEKLKLELVKDYLTDEIKQLETDLQAKLAALRKADEDVARLERLFKSGALTSSELASGQLQLVEKEAEVQKAMQTRERYQKTLARWNEIVGETLDDQKSK
ncbi:MAG: hypothetical protein KDB00_07535, partial [Planctomycetales bacterium]|nr:hypothetical protein [Planctomycetales bacterium]